MVNGKFRKRVVILLAAACLAGAGSAIAHEKKKGSRVPMPSMEVPSGVQCDQPADVMRREHMKFILHKRDDTMHQGIRTVKYSLKNCVNCHANPKTGSVLGKEGFCASCHHYAAVKIDCFECHTDRAEKKASAPLRGRPQSLAPAMRSALDRASRGQQP